MVTKEQLERDAEKPASLLIKDSAALERLASALADGDAVSQDVAAVVCNRVVGRGRWTEVAQAALVRALGPEHSAAVRSAALHSLRRCASIGLAGPALRRMIVDDDHRLREHARALLRVRSNPQADWSEEVRRWADESTGAARSAAIDAYTVHYSLAKSGREWLIAWLDSDDEDVRVAAAGALASALRGADGAVVAHAAQHPQFAASLRTVLRSHPDGARRAHAADCLATSFHPDSTKCLLDATAGDDSQHVRRAACVALQRHSLGFETARNIAMREIERAREGDSDGPDLYDVLELLVSHAEATHFVIEELARETAPASSIAMLHWLGRRSCAPSFDVIAEWVQMPPEQLEVRCAAQAARHREAAVAATAARARGAQALVPALLGLLADPERDATERDSVSGAPHYPRLEFTIIEALTAIGVTSADVRAALYHAHRRGNEYLRRAVMSALGTLGADDDSTVDILLEGLAATDRYSPNVARDALVKLGAPLAPRIAQRLDDQARSEAATRALTWIVAGPEEPEDDHSLSTAQRLAELLDSGSSPALALALLAPNGVENGVVSPLSIALMLHFLGDVVGGSTLAELPVWVGRGNLHVARTVTQLRGQSAPEFCADMALFADPETPLRPEFEQRFDGHLDRVPLDGAEGVRRINEWAHERSRGLIPALLSGLLAETRLALVQLTHFSGRWVRPLTDAIPGATMSFHTARRAWRSVACMSGVVDCPTRQGPDYEAIELPYEPGTTALLLLVPADGGFTRFRAGLDATALEGIVDELVDEVVSLRMPRFSVEATLDSTALLRVLGLDALFTGPDLSGMTPLREAGAHLEVHHAARLRAHELGTDAVATTASFFMGGSPRHLAIDRPFLFFLRHRETGVVLFAGQVTDPVDA